MRRFVTGLAAVAALVPLMIVATPVQAPAGNNGAAIVGGLIAGAAVGAAVSSAARHPPVVYVGPPAPRPAWNAAFQPKPGFWCYPAQRACYKPNGAYASNLTWNTFGR